MLKLVGQIIKYWDFLHSEVVSILHTTQKLKPSGKVCGGAHEALRCSRGKHPFFNAPVQWNYDEDSKFRGGFKISKMR